MYFPQESSGGFPRSIFTEISFNYRFGSGKINSKNEQYNVHTRTTA